MKPLSFWEVVFLDRRLPCGMLAQLNLHLIFNRGEAYSSGVSSPICRLYEPEADQEKEYHFSLTSVPLW